MKKTILILIMLLSQSIFAGNFERFITYLTHLPLQERQSKADSFMKAHLVFPLIEKDTAAIFIYRGEAKSVKIAGDFTGWIPSVSMKGVAGTNIFHSTTQFEKNARLEYKFIVDQKWILDPKNSDSIKGGMGTNSELKMPGYLAPPEVSYYPGIPHGTLLDTTCFSNQLNNTRQVKIYLPQGYSVKKQYPVIVFHDGLEFISLGGILNTLDYLIAHHEMEPVIGIFVPPVDRNNEYGGTKKEAFTTFIVKELMPVIDKKYSTSKNPSKRATFGISEGGNIALYIGMKHPETFGKIAAISSDVQNVISIGISKVCKNEPGILPGYREI